MIAGFGIYLKRGPNRVHRIEAFLERLDPSPPRLEPVTPPKIVSSLTTKKTTVFLPLLSTVFHPDGNSPRKTMENSGRQNLKGGLPPRAEEVIL